MPIVSAIVLLLCIETAAGQTPAESTYTQARDAQHLGIIAQQRGDAKTAIEEYRKALVLDPQLPEARANLGAALAAAGDFDAAIEEDKRALLSAPDKTAVRRNLALAYYKKGDFKNALPEFEAVHAARPQEISAALLLGYTQLKLGDSEPAAQMLAPLEAGHEANADFEFVLASALIDSGKEEEGLPRMERVARSTHSADSWVIAGTTRLHRREFKEAETDLDAAMEIDPAIPGLCSMAGQASDAAGNTDRAKQAFEAALRADPRDFTANLYLGAIRLKQRDLDGARPLLERAVQLQPRMPEARFQLAKLDAMTGKNAAAASTLEDLEKANPKWLDPHVELAAIYYKLHRPEDGQRERDIVQQMETSQQNEGPPKK